MGLFSFFKSKKPVETESGIENVSFDDIGKWLGEKNKSLRENEQETLDEIRGRLEGFYVSLGEKLGVLESIDIESKKEHGRAKLLVRQGLDKYIDSVHILLKDLKALDGGNLGNFAQGISKTFVNFEKTSAKVYERATYLVGDEMAAVRNEIRRFYNGLMEMFEKDGSSIKDLKRVKDIELKLGEFEKSRKDLGEIGGEVELNDLEIERAKKKVEKLVGEVKKIKNSSEYTANLKVGEEVEVLRIGIDREIGKLKEFIDFKKLTNIIHSNERELKIVNDHKEHFASEFSRDSGKKILDLLGGSNMKNAVIEAQVSLIGKRNDELKEKKGNVRADSTIIILGDVKKIEDEIDGMETGKVKVKRRLEELDLKLKGLKNEVVRLVEGFGVGVI
ncbi:MAG: hypothetical protein KKF50_02055 [Nanoarchaeota archaeon]|nr:hypothetical protein [Nanoarchaeota archaeon]